MISKIDKNFAPDKPVKKDGKIFYNLPCAPFEIYGVFYDENAGRFLRMPKEVATATSEGVAWLNNYTAGGRVKFSTDSLKLTLQTTFDLYSPMPHISLLGSNGFTLMEETENGYVHKASFMPQVNEDKGFIAEREISADGKTHNYILFMPNYGDVKTLSLGFDENAEVGSGRRYRDVKPILYYGSSITQGGCASRPDNVYQAYISEWTDTDFINLGFSGNGKAEKVMAEYLATIDCSVFVCDYDYNAPDAEYLKNTHYRLYEIFRKAHKNTPIIFASKPTAWHTDAAERQKIIEATYRAAKRAGDKNVYYIKGDKLFGEEDKFSCTVDDCHPNDLGFYRMAKAFYKIIKNLLG